MKHFLLTIGLCLCTIGVAVGQTTIYSEDFTGEDGKGATGTSSGTTFDTTGVTWTIDVGTTLETDGSTNQFEVVSGVFSGIDVDGSAFWFSPEIDVTSYSAIDLSVDLDIIGGGANASGENITVYYTLNPSAGTPTYTSADSYTQSNDSELPKSISISNIDVSGTNEFGIRIEMDANGGGDGFSFDNVSVEENTVKAEPTNHPTSFSATTDGFSEIDLSWTDATGAVTPDNYLIKVSNVGLGSISDPVDGTAESDDSDLSNGSGAVNISQGTQAASFSGLSDNTQYFFKIYSYTNSGTDINYKTDGTIQSDDATTDDAPDIVINEILADPDGTTGDANGDGTVDTAEDEFVEIVNTGTTDLDISDWVISDGASDRHTFASSTILQPGQAVVVFGGGTPTGDFGGSLVFTASSNSTGFNNGGDDITLKDDGGSTIVTYTYGSEGGDDQSLTRSPDLTGSFAQHETADTDDASSFSPGTKLDGTSFGEELTISGTEGWRMLSFPISGGAVDDISDDTAIQGVSGGDNPDSTSNFMTYDNTGAYETPASVSTNLGNGHGFITYFYNNTDAGSSTLPITLQAFGTEPGSDVSVDLNASNVFSGSYFTMVGNPYASNFDLNSITVTGGTIQNNVAFWDNGASSYSAQDRTTPYIVEPWQGLWVESTDAATSISMPISGKTATAATGTFFSKENPNNGDINFTLSSATTFDKAIRLSARPNATLEYDLADASKFVPLVNSYATMAFVGQIENEEKLQSVFSIPSNLEEAVSIPLRVQADGVSGEFTFAWENIESVSDNWDITLTDHETGTNVSLREANSYTFTFDAPAKKKTRTVLAVVTSMESEDDATNRFGITITPSTTVGIDDEVTGAPTKFALNQNYPNPFNPATTITYSVGESGPVNITVYNVMGRKVAELVNTTKSAGNGYQVSWDATAQASGIYYYRLTAPGQVLTRQMTLIK